MGAVYPLFGVQPAARHKCWVTCLNVAHPIPPFMCQRHLRWLVAEQWRTGSPFCFPGNTELWCIATWITRTVSQTAPPLQNLIGQNPPGIAVAFGRGGISAPKGNQEPTWLRLRHGQSRSDLASQQPGRPDAARNDAMRRRRGKADWAEVSSRLKNRRFKVLASFLLPTEIFGSTRQSMSSQPRLVLW